MGDTWPPFSSRSFYLSVAYVQLERRKCDFYSSAASNQVWLLIKCGFYTRPNGISPMNMFPWILASTITAMIILTGRIVGELSPRRDAIIFRSKWQVDKLSHCATTDISIWSARLQEKFGGSTKQEKYITIRCQWMPLVTVTQAFFQIDDEGLLHSCAIRRVVFCPKIVQVKSFSNVLSSVSPPSR